MNHLYHVTTNFPQLGNTETQVRTNDIFLALDTYLSEEQNGNPVMVVSGMTGEILAIANHEGIADHATDEFGLIIRGYQATLADQEEELMEEEEEETPYPNRSMILTLANGDEVIVSMSEEQMDTIMDGGELVSTLFVY
jgi:hypothetical protein